MKRIKMMPLESSKFDGAAHGHARENEFKPVLSSNPLCGWQHAFFAEGTGDNRGELQPWHGKIQMIGAHSNSLLTKSTRNS